jgi:hypothetical protein
MRLIEVPMMSCSKCSLRALQMTIFALAVSASTALADPPGRVARISFATGSVSFRPGSLDEWSTATVNYPLTIGDHIWTDRGSRGELQIGSTVVRIAPSTELSLLNLDDRTAQFRVTQGAVSVRVRNLTGDDIVEIDTPNTAVSVTQPGLYRVDVSDAGDSSNVTVRRGEVEVSAGGSSFPVRAEEAARLNGLDAVQPNVGAASAFDEFEDWCLTRERSAETAQSTRYVSRDVIGYEDLDANGSWQTAGEYGPVWFPRVRAEWAPYRFGHWIWVDPWGWTWVDEASWGFAPFHYGRWVFVQARGWAWAPGTIVARPVYAPALVAFVGGPTWSASFGVGAAPVAWFPLGPREVFVPAYRVSPVYVQRVNATHVTNVNVTVINNVTTVNTTNVTYVNRSVPGAVTAVPRDAFVSARPVAAAAVAVSRAQVQAAPVVGTAAPVAPGRASIVGLVQVRAAAPPPAVTARQVVVRNAPPPPPVAFAAKQAALEQHPGQPVDSEMENALRARNAQNAATHPLVRTAVVSGATPANRPGAAAPANRPAATAPVPVVQPRAVAPLAPPTPAPPPPAPQRVNPMPPPPAAPPANPSPAAAVARPAGSPADLAARHAQERAQLDARHAQERSTLQAQHQQEQAAADARERAQIQQRHQQELKDLQDRQKQERDATQKRQQEERKAKPR